MGELNAKLNSFQTSLLFCFRKMKVDSRVTVIKPTQQMCRFPRQKQRITYPLLLKFVRLHKCTRCKDNKQHIATCWQYMHRTVKVHLNTFHKRKH